MRYETISSLTADKKWLVELLCTLVRQAENYLLPRSVFRLLLIPLSWV